MATRATKIVATLGPASSDPALLEAMIRAGVNVVRLNFSHGKAQDHIDRATLVRQAAQRAGREVGIMADLQGPKIRVGKFAEGKVQLEPGAAFVLDASRTEPGDLSGVGLGIALMTEQVQAPAEGEPAVTARSWTSAQATIADASIDGIEGLTIAVNTLALQVNREATDGSVVDYSLTEIDTDAADVRNTALDILTGPESSVTLSLDGADGEMTRLTGSLELDQWLLLAVLQR